MITLFGAAPDSGNQGVTALCQSAAAGLIERGLGPITIADYGRGERHEEWLIAGQRRDVRRVGAIHTRRYYRSESLHMIDLALRAGGLGNPCAKALRASRAVLDVSGGDSFTDLYGSRRFKAMSKSKWLALKAGVPLILLPQTLGPFRDRTCREEATYLLHSASAVWTRDVASYELLQELLGEDFDSRRHHRGQDLAILLDPTPPRRPLPDPLASWLEEPKSQRASPIIGINASGLLCNSQGHSQRRFGLSEGHLTALQAVAETLLGTSEQPRLLLIPHVLKPASHPESDWAACLALERRLGLSNPNKVIALPPHYDASELKHILSRLDWFCGARMHACIGAFSSGVPTLPLAYSDKADGVFAACGFPNAVADLRQLDAGELAGAARKSFARRKAQAIEVARRLPELKSLGEMQMDAIAQTVLQQGTADRAA